MNKGQARQDDYLGHILQAIERIESYVADMTEIAFLDSDLVQDAVIRNFEVIGEASHNLQTHFPEFAKANPQLPLAVAYQMRNALAHGYFKDISRWIWRLFGRPSTVICLSFTR